MRVSAARASPSPAMPRSARGLRACRRDDLPAVAALYELVMRSGRREAATAGLARYFERTFFDCPWADEELAPLVYEDQGGGIVGFLGQHVRRVRLDGRVLRLCCGGQLVVDPQARARAVGAILFRSHLLGPQDATFTDGANDTVGRMWELCGGESAPLKNITWTRVLRPLRFGADEALGRLGRPVLARRLRPLWRPLDALALRAAGERLRPAPPRSRAEPLTAQAVLEHLPRVTESARCHPAYDAAFLDWLFREMAAVPSRGELVRSLVRDAEGEVLGWFAYYLRGGQAHVQQVAAGRNVLEPVLDHLLHDAYEKGAAAVRGRLEPRLADALSRRRCLYGWSGAALVHARTPQLLGVLLSSQCWLERLDGESWMGHHTEAFS